VHGDKISPDEKKANFGDLKKKKNPIAKDTKGDLWTFGDVCSSNHVPYLIFLGIFIKAFDGNS
jgi:hypothetical protein